MKALFFSELFESLSQRIQKTSAENGFLDSRLTPKLVAHKYPNQDTKRNDGQKYTSRLIRNLKICVARNRVIDRTTNKIHFLQSVVRLSETLNCFF